MMQNKRPKSRPNPVADEHVVENLHSPVSRQLKRLDVRPAARLKSLGVRHHYDEVVVIAAMHEFECEKVTQGRKGFGV